MSNPNEWDVESAQDLNRRLGLPFSNLSLLIRALTHDSYVNENVDATQDNERLEFLGDAVLGLIVGAWVYNHFPEMPEGGLTKTLSALVCNEQLAKFARKLGLERALRLGRGISITGGHDQDRLLGSAFEALIGALYLDSGFESVVAFVHPLLEGARESILNELHDPKSHLQEWAQSQKIGTPHYKTVSATGPDHAKTFEMEVQIGDKVYGIGSGSSKQTAEHAAAENALFNLGLAG